MRRRRLHGLATAPLHAEVPVHGRETALLHASEALHGLATAPLHAEVPVHGRETAPLHVRRAPTSSPPAQIARVLPPPLAGEGWGGGVSIGGVFATPSPRPPPASGRRRARKQLDTRASQSGRGASGGLLSPRLCDDADACGRSAWA